MKKFLSLSLALIMLFALIPTALSASAAEETLDVTLDCYTTNTNYSWDNSNKCFNITGSSTDQGLVIGFSSSVFNNYNVTKITYSFEGSTGEFRTAKFTAFWSTRGLKAFAYDSSTLPSTAVNKGAWGVYNASTVFSVEGEKLDAIKSNGYTYLYLIHAYSSSHLNKVGTLVPKITITYTVDDPTGAPTTDAVSTSDEASIRLNDQNGIRFYTTVDETKLAELVGENTYEIGTLIAPADALGEDGELTDTDECLKIPYEARDEETGNIDYYNADNKEIVGSIVNIRETEKDGDGDTNGNIDRDFVGRAYVKVGDTYYFSATTSTRSLAQVAYAYKNSASYVQNDKVDQWAAEYVAE